MCGVGLIFSQKLSSDTRIAIAKNMHESLRHRGPDGHGIWSEGGLSIFHRRLAVVDVSNTGQQPMISLNGRWIISFNGEIYNYKNIKKKIDPTKWLGTSDTEVLLRAIETFGLREAVSLAIGMFAAIVWDNFEKKLYLIRDRMGEKPLYYGTIGNDFVVGSELKVFHQHPEFRKEIEPDAVSAYLKYNYVPTPLSIFKNIKKVYPGCIYTLSLEPPFQPGIEKYWSIPFGSKKNQLQKEIKSDSQIKSDLNGLFNEIIERELQADVPVGCFLSGGVDSSFVCSLMTRLHSKPIETFSIGFKNKEYDESIYAKKVAEHLGTKHTEWILNAQDCLSVVEKIPKIYDEPFSDSSQIPLFLLARLARQNVNVVLTGDGGDELFAGYNRYNWAPYLWNKMSFVPHFLRSSFAKLGTKLDPKKWDHIYSLFGGNSETHFGTKAVKFTHILDSNTPMEFHDLLLSQWHHPEDILTSKVPFSLNKYEEFDLAQFEEYLIWHDQNHYLPDDILVKVDRATMANSLESRSPFLDHTLVNYVESIQHHLIRPVDQPKKFIKELLYEHVPAKLIERPKMGFGIPIYDWVKNDLSNLIQDLLSQESLKQQGLFDYNKISKFVNFQLHSNLNQPYHLWNLLIFQLWYKTWIK